MMNTEKIISVIAAAAITLSLTACGENSDRISDESSKPYGTMRDISSAELISEMGAGWNLGNTFDALGEDETAWGNPITTKEMIDEVCNAGFNTIRIPTSWGNYHMGEAPDYTIDSEWMNRVEEVVDYALENDMYVILNTHHETDWIKPQYDGLDEVKTEFAALWTQISDYFSDYGDHLIFEGLNEPRIVGGTNEWNGGTAEGRDALNQLNDLFVKTVRATGGNNENRTLLITTFAASSADIAISSLEIPDDSHVGVSIHAYTPYRFTYDSAGESWNTAVFDDSCAAEIDSLFNSLDSTFISKGIPVIITEYGAVSKLIDKDWYIYNSDEVVKWADYYVSAATKIGIPCIWWDNGSHEGSGELFGIFNRSDLSWYEPELVKAITGAVKKDDSNT